MNEHPPAYFVSVDVETGGPSPSEYPLLSIGACLVEEPDRGFYVELQPVPVRAAPEALAVSGLSLQCLAENGLPPLAAMEKFERWLETVIPVGQRPVFVAYNAAFDWMFVCDYFHRYLGRNPFGHAAVDVKSLFMGVAKVPWPETSIPHAARRYGITETLTHNALEDAVYQAALFRKMREALTAQQY
jgi:ribonuclease T